MFVETESMRIARLEQMLKAALDNDDAIVLDENGDLIERPIRDLTDEEREENDDIL